MWWTHKVGQYLFLSRGMGSFQKLGKSDATVLGVAIILCSDRFFKM